MMQRLITVVIPFDGVVDDVEFCLDNWGNPIRASAKDPAKRISWALEALGVVHFMGIHVIGGDGGRHHLVFELAVDGGPTYVFESIERECGAQVLQLMAAANIVPTVRLSAFLEQHRVELSLGWGGVCGLGFIGTPGFSVRRIRAEAALAELVTAWLRELAPGMPARAKLAAIRARAWGEAGLKWAFAAEPMLPERAACAVAHALRTSLGPLLRDLLWPFLMLPGVCAVLAAVFSGPWSAAAATLVTVALEGLIGAWLYRRLRAREHTDAEDHQPQSAELREQLQQFEAKTSQRQSLVLAALKPGVLRRLTLRFALFAVRQAALEVFAPGRPAHIGTVHFAHWLVLPGTSQLLFSSNHDGTWESQLDDCVDKAPAALTGIWSNTEGFPRARKLFELGATNRAQFKTWACRRQLPARYWYCAYPELTATRIRIHAEIRHGIATARGDADIARWLGCFGAARACNEADNHEALMLGGRQRASAAPRGAAALR